MKDRMEVLLQSITKEPNAVAATSQQPGPSAAQLTHPFPAATSEGNSEILWAGASMQDADPSAAAELHDPRRPSPLRNTRHQAVSETSDAIASSLPSDFWDIGTMGPLDTETLVDQLLSDTEASQVSENNASLWIRMPVRLKLNILVATS
jgi:hypothetical protein